MNGWFCSAQIVPQMSDEVGLATAEVFQACQDGGKLTDNEKFLLQLDGI